MLLDVWDTQRDIIQAQGAQMKDVYERTKPGEREVAVAQALH